MINANFFQFIGATSQIIRDKVQYVFERNAGLHTVELISQACRGDNLNAIERSMIEQYSPEEFASFKYARITFTDVERAFSMYKAMLTDRRRKFTFELFKQFFIIHCFHSIPDISVDSIACFFIFVIFLKV